MSMTQTGSLVHVNIYLKQTVYLRVAYCVSATSPCLSLASYLVFKFRNNDGSILKIFSGGVEVAGKHFAVFEGSADKRLSIRMKGGVYDHVNPLLFFRLE